MISEHLSDEEIQEFVLNKTMVAPGIGEHVQICDLCKARVEAYELVMTAIVQQPAPILDFDVSEMVLATIETQKQKSKNGWIYFFIAVAISITGAIIYLFRKDIAGLFDGISIFIIYLLAITGLLILLAMVADQIKTYKNKITLLDAYE